MTTPSRETVVLQEDDLQEDSPPSGRQRGRIPRGPQSGFAQDLKRNDSANNRFSLGIIISNEDGVSRTLFIRHKTLSAEFDLSRFLLVKLEFTEARGPPCGQDLIGATGDERDSRLQNASSGSFTLRARSSNRVNSFKKVRGISPTGPLRCLAMISSASPSFSARASSSSS